MKYNKENGIIKVLKYVKDKGVESASPQELKEKFKDNLDALIYLENVEKLFKSKYLYLNGDPTNFVYFLTDEGFFKIAEYEQFIITRRISIVAVFIALVSVVATLLM